MILVHTDLCQQFLSLDFPSHIPEQLKMQQHSSTGKVNSQCKIGGFRTNVNILLYVNIIEYTLLICMDQLRLKRYTILTVFKHEFINAGGESALLHKSDYMDQ